MSVPLSTADRGRPIFASREEAGRSLAAGLRFRDPAREAVILALSARALALGRSIARRLPAPLDLALVRHLCLPGGIAIGAVVRGVMLLNDGLVDRMRVPPLLLEGLAAQAGEDLAREEAALRSGWLPVAAAGRIAVLVDDGLGEPADCVAAARALRRQGAAGVLLAVPTIQATVRPLIAGAIDQVVTVFAADDFAGPPCYAEDQAGYDVGIGESSAAGIPAANL